MSKLLVLDHGLFTSFAQRLSSDFDVFYFAPYSDRSFPTHEPAMVGSGLDGVERVSSFWSTLSSLDINEDTIMIPDVGFWDLAVYLRSQGWNVWAAGDGEKLEIQRWRAKETMKALGLPVGECALVTGMTALREYLSKNPETFVKISGFRGLAETFYVPTLELARTRLDTLEYHLGGAREVFPFVVEHMVDSVVEAGYDGFCIDGKFPKTCLTGVEVKDRGYVGAVRDYSKLSDPVKEVNDKLAPFLKEAGYRQFFSTEIRVTESGTPYLIDLTTRGPLPPSELYHAMIDNLGDIIYAGARGEIVEPEWNAKYGALAIIKSDISANDWSEVEVSPEAKPWVKWRNYAEIEGQGHILPITKGIGMIECGAVIGIADTLEEAINACKKNAEGVKGFDVKIHAEALPEALKEIETAEENDIIFTDDDLPDIKELID
jgi:hypothetical protein